jgi:hypothetical protein
MNRAKIIQSAIRAKSGKILRNKSSKKDSILRKGSNKLMQHFHLPSLSTRKLGYVFLNA